MSETFLDITEIQKRIPHRFPFLLIDRVLSYSAGPNANSCVGRKVVALKNVTINEPYFAGHFPNRPVMPGVLQVEAMAQAGCVACVPGEFETCDVLIAKITDARFRRPVIPGDTLIINAEITSEKAGLLRVTCKTTCEGKPISEVVIWAKVSPSKREGS